MYSKPVKPIPMNSNDSRRDLPNLDIRSSCKVVNILILSLDLN